MRFGVTAVGLQRRGVGDAQGPLLRPATGGGLRQVLRAPVVLARQRDIDGELGHLRRIAAVGLGLGELAVGLVQAVALESLQGQPVIGGRAAHAGQRLGLVLQLLAGGAQADRVAPCTTRILARMYQKSSLSTWRETGSERTRFCTSDMRSMDSGWVLAQEPPPAPSFRREAFIRRENICAMPWAS